MTDDIRFMSRALELASMGMGKTSPNPMVGCVIVNNRAVIGEGYHRECGSDHAEVDALKSVSGSIEGATWYVTLEPCSHTGKTPPCVDTIIEAVPDRVVLAMRDPNPLVRQRDSIQCLRDAGITVEVGCLESEARKLNKVFLKTISSSYPYVTLKVAQSLDGKMALASGESSYITSTDSRKRVHELRSYSDAICIGINTVLTDDPLLTIRHDIPLPKRQHPTVIILDRSGKTTADLALFSESNREVIICVDTSCKHQETLSSFATVWELHATDDDGFFKEAMGRAYQEGLSHIFLEGGAGVYQTALSSGLVDECHIFIAPKFMAEPGALSSFSWPSLGTMSTIPVLKHIAYTQWDTDIEVHGFFTDYLEG